MEGIGMDVRDTVAVVTGGARGIGRGIAMALAREGVHVAVADLYTPERTTSGYALSTEREVATTVAELKALGVQAIGVPVDVTKYDQIQDMVQTVTRQLGPIDILCNNAGVIDVALVVDTTEAQWDAMMNVNAKGVFLGYLGTAMWMHVLIQPVMARLGTDAETAFQEHAAANVPLGRPQTPEDIGQAVVYLAKADNVTGIALNVAGGLVLH